MKTLYKLTFLIATLLVFTSCGDDFYDVNTPYGSVQDDQLTMRDLMAPAIFHTFDAQYSAASSFGYYTQYFVSREGSSIGSTETAGLWSNSYLYVIPNLQNIVTKADEVGSNSYRGVANVLLAMNLGLLTDSYDNVPYTEASERTENLTPTFDKQEDLYATILKLLDDAITDLSATDNSGFSPGSDDLIYGGDLDKWIRTAYTLKARYLMHLSEVNGPSVATDVLAALDMGYSSNGDDFQMFYDSRNINPYHSTDVLAANTGNFHRKVGDQIVRMMNGQEFPFTTIDIDPRLPLYADNMGAPGDPYRGYVSGGLGLSSDGMNGNTDFADNGFYSSLDSPIVILSYAEALFLRAEAEFLKNGGSPTSVGSSMEAYDAYKMGIDMNMEKLGVDGTDYLAEASIDVGAGAIMLKDIMVQKYIALFLNPETFVDYRRYDFADDVYPHLMLPLDNADTDYPGEWYVRSLYPTTERERNPANVSANAKDPIVPVWWDR